MKPIIQEGDYVISVFDETDNEIKQILIPQGLSFAVDNANDTLRNYPIGYSYRIMRCLKNSKYDIHSPGAKT